MKLEQNAFYRAALLADDMGLGKTTIALAVTVQNPLIGPTLILAPSDLIVKNWEEEIQTNIGGNYTVLAFPSVPSARVKGAVPPTRWKDYTYVVLNLSFLNSDRGKKPFFPQVISTQLIVYVLCY